MQENAEKLLVALYAEVNSKKPHLANINIQLGFEQQILGRAVNTLYSAGLISGVEIIFGDEDTSPTIAAIEDILITRRGAHYVEQSLQINANSSRAVKLQVIITEAQARGWNDVKAVAINAMAEFLQY